MIERARGKYLVVAGDPETLRAFRREGFPVNFSLGLACITKDYHYVFEVGGKYVFQDTEEPSEVVIGDSVEELAVWVLEEYWGLAELAGLVRDGKASVKVYEESPWAEAGWEGTWDSITGGIA